MTRSGEKCRVCGDVVPGYDGVFVSSGGQQKFHCNRCYNRLIGEECEIRFDHPDFQPVTLMDVDGVTHEFHFTTRILPTGVSIEALEIKGGNPEGYEFRVIGAHETDILAVFGELYERVRNALSQKHIEMGEHGLRITDGDTVRGRITCDDETSGHIPLLIIDGKPVSWEQLGRMLMTYEGFNFKLEIFDPSQSR